MSRPSASAPATCSMSPICSAPRSLRRRGRPPSRAHSCTCLPMRRLRRKAPRRSSRTFRNLAKRLAGGEWFQADQPRILDRGLPVFHGFPIERIADHFDKGGNAGIFGDEAMIPAFLRWPDQHQFKAALPDHLAAETGEDGAAFTAIGGIG